MLREGEVVVFRAILDDEEIIEWLAPQTWHHVFSTFKIHCDLGETHGFLYKCTPHGDVLVRESGKNGAE